MNIDPTKDAEVFDNVDEEHGNSGCFPLFCLVQHIALIQQNFACFDGYSLWTTRLQITVWFQNKSFFIILHSNSERLQISTF